MEGRQGGAKVFSDDDGDYRDDANDAELLKYGNKGYKPQNYHQNLIVFHPKFLRHGL